MDHGGARVGPHSFSPVGLLASHRHPGHEQGPVGHPPNVCGGNVSGSPGVLRRRAAWGARGAWAAPHTDLIAPPPCGSVERVRTWLRVAGGGGRPAAVGAHCVWRDRTLWASGGGAACCVDQHARSRRFGAGHCVAVGIGRPPSPITIDGTNEKVIALAPGRRKHFVWGACHTGAQNNIPFKVADGCRVDARRARTPIADAFLDFAAPPCAPHA
jgi:hypothetical protein